jgi:hypothetical protein
VKLVRWVNEEVRFFLRDSDESRRLRITEQNLSEWRSGGYQDWLRHEEARQFLKGMAEQAGEMDEAADGKSICDRFGALVAVDMARLAKKFLEQETDDEKRWARLKEISKELSRLRRDEHRAMCTWIKREQWEWRREREDHADEEERIQKEERSKWVAALFSPKPTKGIPEMDGGKKVSGSRVQGSGPKARPAPRGESDQKSKAEGGRQNAETGRLSADDTDLRRTGEIDPTESDRIRLNPTKNDARRGEGSKLDGPLETGNKPGIKATDKVSTIDVDDVAASGTGALRLNPTKSNLNESNSSQAGEAKTVTRFKIMEKEPQGHEGMVEKGCGTGFGVQGAEVRADLQGTGP